MKYILPLLFTLLTSLSHAQDLEFMQQTGKAVREMELSIDFCEAIPIDGLDSLQPFVLDIQYLSCDDRTFKLWEQEITELGFIERSYYSLQRGLTFIEEKHFHTKEKERLLVVEASYYIKHDRHHFHEWRVTSPEGKQIKRPDFNISVIRLSKRFYDLTDQITITF